MMKGTVLSGALLPLASLAIAVLSIVSFIFTVVSLTSADWATQALYDVDVVSPSIDTRVHSATVRRGPFTKCVSERNESDPSGPWSNNCDDSASCQSSDLAWWCQQQRTGSHLLIAGCVFSGLACLYALAVLGVTLPMLPSSSRGTPGERSGEGEGEGRGEKAGWRHRLSRWRHPNHEQRLAFVLARGILCALLVLSIVLFAGGTLLLSDLLVNNQPPDGDFVTSSPSDITADHWLMGNGIVYANLGWLPNLIALLCLPSVEMVFVRGRR
ncbi:hypothetical protein C8A01DRAFT_35798 [Parachaetomium inaequale]|uniref:Uncharacterized protein n=1 Tax=Parachaetomium inaequale TaxID=2588326 RepID=A0AAN6PFX8_9PEZI|nr:hypothetical protein C8A01DRAFT_35798 [Parachaetomium inaequale]